MASSDDKAVALVVRYDRSPPQLLVFDHLTGQFDDPRDAVQLPKGTIRRGEAAQAAALRELREESGVHDVRDVRFLGRINAWHLFSMQPASALPDTWVHHPTGSTAESAARFRFRWLSLDRDLPARISPRQRHCAEALLDAAKPVGDSD